MQTYGCCFTGYRPEKFDFELGDNNETRRLQVKLMQAFLKLIKAGVTEYYCGCASGFDILAAEMLLESCEYRQDIHLHLVFPFADSINRLDENWRSRLVDLMSYSDSRVLISDGYHRGVYDARNRYMVDRSLFVLTYYDGKAGGTQSTLKYALKKNKRIINLKEDFLPEISVPLRYPYIIVEGEEHPD